MPDSNRNRDGIKDSDVSNSKGQQQNTDYQKLPDNPDNPDDGSISTRDDSANGKNSRTGIRDEDADNNNIRGGS